MNNIIERRRQDFHPKLGDVKSRIENNLEKAGIYA